VDDLPLQLHHKNGRKTLAHIALFSFYFIYLFILPVLYLYEEPPVPVLNAQMELGIWFGSGSIPVLGNLD
jgi:hypothetical protein